MGESTDEAVWRRIVAGDARAFGLIWDRHADRVVRHLLADGHQQADAEELAATAFLELWRRRSAVRFVDGSALPWLIVTTRNVARNARRARRRYARLLSSLPMPQHVPDPAEHVADLDASTRLLRETIRSANPVDGDLLAMTALEGFSLRDAALAVGMTEPAARSRLSRFRIQLRSHLANASLEGGS
ncbi:sigma-70 family RNA polymerase sigma factor [Microbacterium sp.]|uniref:RNA polymerase sigma factor n=1 Tax=Microbacterium sp. TaxID=51671 RepID=UPI00260C567D|nr:sigma-70 family RNA polymerase sigma factor [Microbacterium sp.]